MTGSQTYTEKDWLIKENAYQLAARIEKYWRDKGYKINTFLELSKGGYGIRSNLFRGLPRHD